MSGTSKPFSRMHWANTRFGSLLAALVAAALGLFVDVDEVDEPDDPVDPQALRAAASVMAMTARARVCAQFFIENSLRNAIGNGSHYLPRLQPSILKAT